MSAARRQAVDFKLRCLRLDTTPVNASESREACEAALRREPSVVVLPLIARSAQLTQAAFRDLFGDNHLTIKPLPVALAE